MLASIIIPYTERSTHLDLCLHSLVAQSYRPLEIILVSRCTSGKSYERCKHFMQTQHKDDFKIRLLYSRNGSASAARNEGLRQSQGEYVCFFDSDDEMSPNFVTQLVTLLEHQTTSPQAKWVLTRSRMFFPSGKSKVRSGWAAPSLEAQVLGGFVSTQSWLARRCFLQQVAQKSFPNTAPCTLWHEDLPVWNDYELGFRLLKYSATPPLWCEAVFHRIYQHPHSITATHNAQDRLKALITIAQQITPTSQKKATRLFAALYWRAAILDGQSGTQLRHLLWEQFPPQIFGKQAGYVRCIARLLYHYVRYRGIAAWRIALCGLYWLNP